MDGKTFRSYYSQLLALLPLFNSD